MRLFYETYESVCLNEYRNRVKCVHTDSDMGQWGYFLLNNKFWREVLTLSTTFISAKLYYEFVRSICPSPLSLHIFLKTLTKLYLQKSFLFHVERNYNFLSTKFLEDCLTYNHAVHGTNFLIPVFSVLSLNNKKIGNLSQDDF